MFVFPNIARVVKPDSVTKIGLSYYVLSTVRDFLLPEIVESIIQRDHIAVDTTDDIIQQHPDLVGGRHQSPQWSAPSSRRWRKPYRPIHG